MFGLPGFFEIGVFFLLGSIFGSFLDVVVCRFHTGKSLNGRSRCLSCGHALSWYELFPLLSYLFLRGRCYQCGARIPVRLFLMELGTGFMFIFVYMHAVNILSLALGLVLASICIVVALYDIKHMVIPNAFVLLLLAMSFVILGSEVYLQGSFTFLLPHMLTGVSAGLFYASLWFLSKGKWIGFGDAKLAIPLGLVLAPGATLSFVILSFWVGAVLSLILLFTQYVQKRGKHHLRFVDNQLTMKSEVPFAPFMLIAFFLVYYAHVDVLNILTFSL